MFMFLQGAGVALLGGGGDEGRRGREDPITWAPGDSAHRSSVQASVVPRGFSGF